MNERQIMMTPIIKLTKDALNAIRAGQKARAGGNDEQVSVAGAMSTGEARILIDLYYQTQEMRKRLYNQINALEKGKDTCVTHEFVDFIAEQVVVWEQNSKRFLELFSEEHGLWTWFERVDGIGPVIATGLVAHLGRQPVPDTVGHWWRHAGLDPSQKWLKVDELEELWKTVSGDIESRLKQLSFMIGRRPETVLRDATTDFRTGEQKKLTKDSAIKSLARIPYNKPLKTLCWKITDQFIKLKGKPDSFYSNLYFDIKYRQIEQNESGGRREMAAETLKKYPNHKQRKIYQQGKIPDGRLILIARRKTVKIFLSHMHHVWHLLDYGKPPPKPFAISIQGHGHYIPPPYMDVIDKAT